MSETEPGNPQPHNIPDNDFYDVGIIKREMISPLPSEYTESPYGVQTLGHMITESLALMDDIPDMIEELGMGSVISRRVEQLRSQIGFLQGTRRGEVIDSLYADYPVPEDLFESAEDGQGLVESLSTASDEAIINFVKWNAEYIDAMNAEEGEGLRSELEEAEVEVVGFLKNSGLPVDMDRIQEKIARLKIQYVDPFSYTESDMAGFFDADDELIGISPIAHDNRKQIIVHELMHAISGRKVVRSELGYGMESVSVKGVGYRLGGRDSHEQLNNLSPKHRWLNEAITEQFTQLILNEKPIDFETLTVDKLFDDDFMFKGVYVDQKMFTGILLRAMEEAGQEIVKPLVSGFFEDYEPDNSPGQRNPHWRESMRLIGDFTGPEALRSIDRVFTQDGYVFMEDKDYEWDPETEFADAPFVVVRPKSREEMADLQQRRHQSGSSNR